MKTVVKPNVDTYYSIAWLDLSDEPQLLYMPATERYYLLPFYDAFTNVFASPGTRTTGTSAQEFMIARPNWEGNVPKGVQLIQAPTEMVWMIGRIQVDSPEDGNLTVRAIQDAMRLIPLSARGIQDYVPRGGDVQEAYENVIPSKAIRNLDVNNFLSRAAQLMVKNPPSLADSTIINKLSKIGFQPGKSFEVDSDNIVVRTKLNTMH